MCSHSIFIKLFGIISIRYGVYTEILDVDIKDSLVIVKGKENDITK